MLNKKLEHRFFFFRTQILPHESDYLSKALERLARNEIYGVVCVILNNIAYHNKFKAHIGIVHAMTNPILTYSIAMHYPKNSPLAEHFDKIINKLQPSGIADHWANNYGNNGFLHQIKQTYNVPKPLTNAQLIGLYKVSTLLLSIAIIVFLCELLYSHFGFHHHIKTKSYIMNKRSNYTQWKAIEIV